MPVVELLLENGYQPTVYRDVLVCSSPGDEPRLQAFFNPLTEDQWLDLDGKNRWAAGMCYAECTHSSTCCLAAGLPACQRTSSTPARWHGHRQLLFCLP